METDTFICLLVGLIAGRAIQNNDGMTMGLAAVIVVVILTHVVIAVVHATKHGREQ